MKGEPTRFKPGNALSKGRQKGTRNHLSAAFIADLVEEWRQHGAEILRIVRAEEPATLLKVIASVIPKEIEVTPSALAELTDEQLDIISGLLASRRGSNPAGDRGGEGQTLN